MKKVLFCPLYYLLNRPLNSQVPFSMPNSRMRSAEKSPAPLRMNYTFFDVSHFVGITALKIMRTFCYFSVSARRIA